MKQRIQKMPYQTLWKHMVWQQSQFVTGWPSQTPAEAPQGIDKQAFLDMIDHRE
jgi:hypothetical protein